MCWLVRGRMTEICSMHRVRVETVASQVHLGKIPHQRLVERIIQTCRVKLLDRRTELTRSVIIRKLVDGSIAIKGRRLTGTFLLRTRRALAPGFGDLQQGLLMLRRTPASYPLALLGVFSILLGGSASHIVHLDARGCHRANVLSAIEVPSARSALRQHLR
jgi:hypothetical protein